MRSAPSSTRGILKPAAADARCTFSLPEPCGDLAPLVERYWIVRWDLRGQDPFIAETLPYPCVNAVFDEGSHVWGVCTRKFRRRLEGRGQAFGIKFRPGGFHPWFLRPIAELTDRTLLMGDVFDPDVEDLADTLLRSEDDRDQVRRVDEYLRARLPAPDPNVGDVVRIVQTIFDHRSICRVDELADCKGLTVRALQRLFREYVGVSPKSVIRRRRLQEAAERAWVGDHVEWASLAAELGYFDQSHFIRDFQAQIGCSPTDYAAARPIREKRRPAAMATVSR